MAVSVLIFNERSIKMKTFRQWFDAFGSETQKYLKEQCHWIDVDQPDGYRHASYSKDFASEQLNKSIEYFDNRLKDDNGLYREDFVPLCMNYIQSIRNTLDKHTFYMLLLALIKENRAILTKLDAMDLREILKIKAEYKNYYYQNSDYSYTKGKVYKYSLDELLLITEDFDNIEWDKADVSDLPLTSSVCEILGEQKLIELCKEEPSRFRLHSPAIQADPNNVIFDTLFFCDNGWTVEQKKKVIDNYGYCERDVEDFMKRIVAVDESYLRTVGNYFIRNNPALGMYLYKQKKPEDELNALPPGHKVEEEYRYPKAYRKLFQIAACCARGRIGKAMAGTIGDAACMLKLYGYNFNNIFDCLYPEYAQTTTTESQMVTI